MGVQHGFDLPDTSCVNKEVDPFKHKLMKIVKPFKLATLLKFERKREHFTRHGVHLNATGKALAAKLIFNWVNSIFIQKREKPISLGWKVKPNDCISEVNEVKQDCFSLITSTSNDVNNLNNKMSGAEMVNLVCCENHSSSKDPLTKAAINKTSGRIRKAPVTKSNAFFLW